MKTAQPFHLYIARSLDQTGLPAALAGAGLESQALGDPVQVIKPALVLLASGEVAPEGLADIAIEVPGDTSPTALRELVRIAIENIALKQQVTQLEEQARRQHGQFEELNRIGIALSAERDIEKLQKFILTTMQQLTNADGASLWLKREEDGMPKLALASSQNSSIENDTYQDFTVPVDDKTVVGYAVTTETSQIYEDAYNPPPGRPQGGKNFDAQYGYRTKSMLTVPMRNYNHEVVGAVQLINAKRHFETKLTVDNVATEVVSFKPEDLEMLESVASQAAVAIDNKSLLKEIEDLFDKFVTASVYAIEQRDPSTAGHSGRVETLTTTLAREVTRIDVGTYRDIMFSDDQLKELRYACLLHDFGKIGVKEDILVKAKKLYPYQLGLIEWRFDSVQRWAQNKHLVAELEAARRDGVDAAKVDEIRRRLDAEIDQFRSWFEAIETANEPSVLPEDKASILVAVKEHAFPDMTGKVQPLIAPQEFHFLSVQKGTLTDEERKVIESHVTKSHDFLARIPWTAPMKNIPDIAWGHHEKLDGSGYPRGLRGDEIPIQTRMMTISDIYDALTARDRTYKAAVPTQKALDMLHAEADRGELDQDLLKIFIDKRVYEVTANT
ncbi:MAG TPA: HD domain-containing phosphohydrolase [Candidatus Baltobacterales bacterium]|nr:HD domain-containing phosphohydrolase [Candidatus Baltobacterales bacterium]